MNIECLFDIFQGINQNLFMFSDILISILRIIMQIKDDDDDDISNETLTRLIKL